MRRTTIITALSLILTTACGGSPEGDPGPQPQPPPPQQGAGGSDSSSSSAGGQGQGGNPIGGQGGGGGSTTVVYDTAVGAAYPNGGDGRIVLIDATGTRTVLYNPAAGTFESGDDIDELEGGPPIMDVVAAARLAGETYLFDGVGDVTVYDHAQASFSAPEPLADALDDVPFTSVGAAFGYGNQIFVFNAGGTSYAAYNMTSETWSPTYSFLADFGGGGAPLASVGAAYALDDGSIVLFDKSGTSYCVYTGNGEFSDDFDIEELGDGSLDFNDVSGD